MVDEITDEQVETVETDAPEAEVETDAPEPDEAEQDFDRDKALQKIRKLNSENRNLREREKQAAAKAAEAGDSSERVVALEAENTRFKTLAEHDLPLKLAKFISATEASEILEQAEELLALGSSKRPPSQQPKERLRGGGDPTIAADPTSDLAAFAADIFKN